MMTASRVIFTILICIVAMVLLGWLIEKCGISGRAREVARKKKRKLINWDNPPAELGYKEFTVPINWVPILKRNSMEGEFKLIEEMDDLCKVKITTGTYIMVTKGWITATIVAMRRPN